MVNQVKPVKSYMDERKAPGRRAWTDKAPDPVRYVIWGLGSIKSPPIPSTRGRDWYETNLRLLKAISYASTEYSIVLVSGGRSTWSTSITDNQSIDGHWRSLTSQMVNDFPTSKIQGQVTIWVNEKLQGEGPGPIRRQTLSDTLFEAPEGNFVRVNRIQYSTGQWWLVNVNHWQSVNWRSLTVINQSLTGQMVNDFPTSKIQGQVNSHCQK